MGNSKSKFPELQNVPSCQTEKFMGVWFVIGVKPTMFEKTCSNAVEKYTFLRDSKKNDIDIDFTYNANEPITSRIKALPQKGWVQGDDKSNSPLWKVSPQWPIKLPYHIIELGDDYEYCVIGYPNREYAWIMARRPVMDEALYDDLTTKLVEKHQYSLEGFRKVPQKWTKAEREKRGISVDDLPDEFLSGA